MQLTKIAYSSEELAEIIRSVEARGGRIASIKAERTKGYRYVVVAVFA